MTRTALKKLPFVNRFIGDLNSVRQLLPFFTDMKPLILLSIFLGILSSIVESTAVGLIVLFVFKSLSGSFELPVNSLMSDFFSAIDTATGDNVILIWTIIIITVVAKSLIIGAYNILGSYITNTIHHKIRSALFEKYMALPYKDLAKMDYGTMTNALQVECWYVSEVVQALASIVIALCALFVYLLIILFFSWPLALLVIVLGVFIKVMLAGLKQPLRRLGFEVTKINEELALRMYTRMQAIRTIRAHGLEHEESRSFVSLSDAVARAFTRMSLVETYLRPVNDISVLVIIAALIWLSMTIGNPVTVTATVIALLYKLQPYIYRLEGALMTLVKAQGSLTAVLKQLKAPDMRDEATATLPMPSPWKTIRFDSVSFAYDHETVIDRLSFELPRGKVLAIRGLSGAGKSTLVNLFLKLTRPTSGKIWIDDLDFDQVNREQWLSGVAAAGQDFELMDGTLYENLTLGRNIPAHNIQDALEIAAIKDFVDALPDGLGTKVGERGIRLSGGQRQRIVLARALASAPAFLIMDEATSAVSINVEKQIYQMIKDRRPDMTLILVTHRDIPDGLADLQISV
ncbi:MAG: ABC transporter ATP-binding protein [Rhodospirillales bacterium]|nr:ABC transporter ATP-binding protein [Rhodospirillales bacterium]